MKKLISILFVSMSMLFLASCSDSDIATTKKPFPIFVSTDFDGNTINNDIFSEYDATIINFWSNGCGSCIAEMPELEEYYQDFKGKNINLMAVAVSAGESDVEYAKASQILKEKKVTYTNIIPDVESDFYKNFVCEITGYPITYIVDKDGNMIGAPLVGVVKNQEELLMKRLSEYF